MSRHDKFKAYWESLKKPDLEYLYTNSSWMPVAKLAAKSDPSWDENADYRIAGDLHWELRREWVDSDFTLLIEYTDGISWQIATTPAWREEAQYRRAKNTSAGIGNSGRGWFYGTLDRLNPTLQDKKTGEWTDDQQTQDQQEPEEEIQVLSQGEYGVDHPLYDIFMDAIEQATGGKGVRHGGAATPFFEQPWNSIAKHTGFRGLMFQMIKKAEEACDKDNMETFERELLGSMVYGAMALLYARKHGYTKQVKV
jgi:hypothetical protein